MKYTGQTVKIGNINCRQVNKITAKKLYIAGTEVFIHPCNMILNNAWVHPMVMNRNLETSRNYVEDFEIIVNGYEFYNCVTELGKYANFFTKK